MSGEASDPEPLAAAPPRAAVTRLKLTNFRNYPGLDLSLDARPVCLYGANGAGKTNLVEAVSFLGPGRGLRAAGAEAVRRRDASGPAEIWAVFAEAITPQGKVALATGADPDQPSRRKTRLEGAAATQTELARLLPMLWLTPREDRLWAGPRADRLRFFDRLVLSGEPSHGQTANAYEKALKERQRLLDLINGHQPFDFQPGLIARALRAVLAVLGAGAGLDREQGTHLHPVGLEVLPVNGLRLEQQVHEGLAQQSEHFLTGPVVTAGGGGIHGRPR